MRKTLLFLVAVLTSMTMAAQDGVTITLTDLTADSYLDATDGTFKVTASYDLNVPESLQDDYLDACFYYTVEGTDNNYKGTGQANAQDIYDGKVNFYVSNLEADKNYKLTVDKIEVFDVSQIDWDTFEIPTVFLAEGELKSVEFAVYNAPSVEVLSLTQEKAFDTDATLKVTLNYSASIPGSCMFPDITFIYTVKDEEGTLVDSGEKNPQNVSDGTLNIYVNNLKSSKKYTMSIDTVKVFDYALFDYDTFECPPILVATPAFSTTIAVWPVDITLSALTPDVYIDATDGTFKVGVSYDVTFAESIKDDYFDACFCYTVEGTDNNYTYSGLANPQDVSAGSLNFYVSNLEAGKSYKLTVNKIEVFDYTQMDWDTFEAPTVFLAEGELLSVDFTVTTATGLESLPGDDAAATEASEIYNLSGMKMSKAMRGVNIIGGKKVLK